MQLREKIIARAELAVWRQQVRATGKRLVVTNGCFDLLHAGHVTYLEKARAEGDLLLVGLNSDTSVRAIKGEGRPVNTQEDRAVVVAGLGSVDAVCVFDEPSAADFLALAAPDVYVKGGDYTVDTLNQAERQLVENAGGRIVLIPMVPGKSTTSLLNRLGHC